MPLQGPEYIWVDNSDQSANILCEIFPSVKGVLEDSTHLMRRYMRTLTPGHPLNRELPATSLCPIFEMTCMTSIYKSGSLSS